MAGKPMEVFPDLHHKMSKKIAQLTKVIYHLNTKNEDHQTELEIITSNHQMEIQQILKDAAARIGKFKELVETKQAAINQDAKIEKLQKKHDTEKQAALSDFNKFKAKMSDREQKLTGEYQTKFQQLRTEIEQMNSKFQERIKQFEDKNAALKTALDAASRSGSEGIDAMRAKYEAEIADVVREGNEKYQSMLLDQLAKLEEYKKETEKRISDEKQRLESGFKADLERELGQVRAKLNGDKQSELLNMKRDFESRIAEQKADLWAKMEKLIADLKQKDDECERLRKSKDETIDSLNQRMFELQQSLGDQLGGKEARLGSLSHEVGSLKEQNLTLEARVAQKTEEIEALQKILSEKSALLAAAESKNLSSVGEIVRLRAELDTANRSGASTESELRTKLATSEKEASSFRSEINQMGTALAGARDELRKAEKASAKAVHELEKKLQALQMERDTLKGKIDDIAASADKSTSQASKELQAVKAGFAEREAAMREERAQLVQTQQRAMDSLAERHKAEVAALHSAKQTLADNFSLKEQQLQSEIGQLKAVHEAAAERMAAEHQRAMEEAQSRLTETEETYKASVSALEGQIQSITEQADADRSNLRADLSKQESKAKALQRELDAKRKESERSESVMTGLKNQIESLREELKASQKAFREKMDMSTAKLEAQWQSKLDAAIAAGQKELEENAQYLKDAHKSETEELIRLHGEEVAALKSLLQKENAAAAAELAQSEKLRERLEADLNAEKLARAAQVAEMSAAHSNESKGVQDAHKQEAERLRRELTSAAEARETQMAQAHGAEVASLKQLMESRVAEISTRMDAALEASKLTAEDTLRKALAELETRLQQEKSDALSAQASKTAQKVADLEDKHKSEQNVLNRELEEIKNNLRDSAAEISSIQQMILNERAARQQREEAFVLERDQLLREHEGDLRKEREHSERKVQELLDRVALDTKLLKQEHADVRGQYEERVREVQREYKVLEERYINRESRPEDLAKIQQLLQELSAKDELVKKTMEEMLYFKREMLNREENYNQKFGAAPNVGVMNVLKNKSADTAGPGVGSGGFGGGSSRSKPTQMRAVNPNGGAMMGGGLGIGVGGGGMGSSNNGGRSGPGQPLTSSSSSAKTRAVR